MLQEIKTSNFPLPELLEFPCPLRE